MVKYKGTRKNTQRQSLTQEKSLTQENTHGKKHRKISLKITHTEIKTHRKKTHTEKERTQKDTHTEKNTQKNKHRQTHTK